MPAVGLTTAMAAELEAALTTLLTAALTVPLAAALRAVLASELQTEMMAAAPEMVASGRGASSIWVGHIAFQ